MPVHAHTCPSCSAPITIPPNIAQMFCPFCSTPLSIQREAGTIQLDIVDRIAGAIEESAGATQVELRRLQLSQELSALRSQLSHVRSEIRIFEREPETAETLNYLSELYAEAHELEEHIGDLRLALQPNGGPSISRPARPPVTRPNLTSRATTPAPQPIAAASAPRTGWLWLFFSVQGRASRGQFLVGLAGVAVLVLILSGLLSNVPSQAEIEAGAAANDALTCVFMPLTLLVFWMGAAVGAKRYHDRGKSGWWILLGWIPFVNLWVLFELAFLPGTSGPNPHGAPAAW